MPVYAHCPNCGLDFEMAGFEFLGSSNVRFLGNRTNCPRCGGAANVMDGEFQFAAGGRMDVLSAPAWTRELLHRMTPAQARRIQNGAVWAQSTLQSQPEREEEVETKFVALISREAPWLAEFVNKALSSKTASLLGIISFVFMLLTFFGVDPGSHQEPQQAPVVITDDQLEKMFDEYLERHQQDEMRSPTGPMQEESTPPEPPTIATRAQGSRSP